MSFPPVNERKLSEKVTVRDVPDPFTVEPSPKSLHWVLETFELLPTGSVPADDAPSSPSS